MRSVEGARVTTEFIFNLNFMVIAFTWSYSFSIFPCWLAATDFRLEFNCFVEANIFNGRAKFPANISTIIEALF